MSKPIPNALTVDVEDYFHVSNFEAVIARDQWANMSPTAPDAVRRIIDTLARYKVTGTFFVLGWMAQHHPDLVPRLVAAGHEVACHGFNHECLHALSPRQFRDDIRRAKALLEDQAGVAVNGYRAPSFTINAATEWAIEVLIEEGFTYDSSIFPGRKKMPIGFLGVDRRPIRLQRPAGSLVELPLARLEVLGKRLPFSGGGPFRAAPWFLIRAGVRDWHLRQGLPFVLFFHPWEIVPDQKRVPAGPMESFKHYFGLRGFERKIHRLLREFSFGPARDLLPLAD